MDLIVFWMAGRRTSLPCEQAWQGSLIDDGLTLSGTPLESFSIR